MWHELVLNGIGGRTIAEAQERISYPEFLQWVTYRRKRGTLNLGMRVEHGSALLAALYANSKSKNGGHKVIDFMPHQEEAPISLDDAMEKWR